MPSKFLKRKEEIDEFERVTGIDLSELTYNEKCAFIRDYEQKQEKQDFSDKVLHKQPTKIDPSDLRRFRGKRVLIAPEIAPTKVQLVKYDEELGDDMDVEEVYYDIKQAMAVNHTEHMTKSYNLRKNGKKVVAQSTLPKENAKIDFNIVNDMFPVITFQGKRGYPWTHQSLPNVSEVLKQSGYYEEYKDQFNNTPNVFYLTGILCCSIDKTHSIMNEIERKERQRRAKE